PDRAPGLAFRRRIGYGLSLELRELGPLSRLRIVSLAAACAAAMALAGCGYRPLYGDRGAVGGSDVRQRLAEVKIAGIADRRGQLVRNFLLDRMNAQGEPAQARYVLSVTTAETARTTDSRPDGTATRADLVLGARFSLRDANSDAIVFVDRTEGVATYNLLTNRYASVASEDEARRRAAEYVADQIALQVALFLNRRHGQPAGAEKAAPGRRS
ncbi:MAG: LPS assembly lipoprotein LptE, partial [Alphaproteobacteria bacterium]